MQYLKAILIAIFLVQLSFDMSFARSHRPDLDQEGAEDESHDQVLDPPPSHIRLKFASPTFRTEPQPGEESKTQHEAGKVLEVVHFIYYICETNRCESEKPVAIFEVKDPCEPNSQSVFIRWNSEKIEPLYDHEQNSFGLVCDGDGGQQNRRTELSPDTLGGGSEKSIPEPKPDTAASEQNSEKEQAPQTDSPMPEGIGPAPGTLKPSKGYTAVPIGEKVYPTKRGGANAYCGAYHYYVKSNHRGATGEGNDWNAYFKESNTCAMMLVLEKWNAEICKDSNDKGCRISFGDASRKHGGKLAGHKMHNLGRVVDVRLPMHENLPFKEIKYNYTNKKLYSREYTQKLVNLFKEYGARSILFNDPKVSGVIFWKNHGNHLHVRFDQNKTRRICEQKKNSAEHLAYRRKCPKLY